MFADYTPKPVAQQVARTLTGELPIRTGMTTVGQAGAKIGIPAEAVTTATVLKSMEYATGPSGEKITSAISMNSCPAFAAATNISAVSIT